MFLPLFSYNGRVIVAFSDPETNPAPSTTTPRAVAIATKIIASVRVAKTADIGMGNEKMVRTVEQSVTLTPMIPDEG